MIQMAKIKTLRSEKSFDRFIDQDKCAVIVYHFLCPACISYHDEVKTRVGEMGGIPMSRIHLNLEWVIREAGMVGDVAEENTFLVDRYGLGDQFPVTLLFENGQVIKRVNGALTAVQLKGLFDVTFKNQSDEASLVEGAVCTSESCDLSSDK